MQNNKYQITGFEPISFSHGSKKIISINLDVFSPGADANSIFANFSAKKLPTAFFFELQIARRIGSRRIERRRRRRRRRRARPHRKSFILIEIIEKLLRRFPSCPDAPAIVGVEVERAHFYRA